MAYFSLGMVTTTAHYYWKLQAPHSGGSFAAACKGNLLPANTNPWESKSLGNLKDLRFEKKWLQINADDAWAMQIVGNNSNNIETYRNTN